MQNIIALNFPAPIRRIPIRFNFKAFCFSMVLSIFCLLGFYIFQINNFVSSNYSLHNLEKDIKNLTLEKEKIEIQLAAASSLNNIEDLVLKAQFEKINQIHYIQVQDNLVAVAK